MRLENSNLKKKSKWERKSKIKMKFLKKFDKFVQKGKVKRGFDDVDTLSSVLVMRHVPVFPDDFSKIRTNAVGKIRTD